MKLYTVIKQNATNAIENIYIYIDIDIYVSIQVYMLFIVVKVDT